MSLEIVNLSHSIGRKQVLREVSLRLKTGELGCLLGPSGCGKTTLLRAIAGFESIDAGEIRVAGQLVSSATHFTAPESRRVALVFQDFALFPHLSVEENLVFGLRNIPRSERLPQVLIWAERLGLMPLLSRMPHELSGGEQQRVALGRALVLKPDLLLLDEPFSSLDGDLRVRLAVEVKDFLRDQGITALLVTHDQHEAFAFADQVTLLVNGKIEQQGTPYDLYHRPMSRLVADLVGEGVFISAHPLDKEHVSTSLGNFHAVIPEGVNGPLDFLVRPDDVLHDDDSPVQALIVKKIFRGANFLYTLALSDGTTVMALAPSHHDHVVGQKIGIRLDIEHGVAFPRVSLG
jgi:iron(III) transport system ATP-binding protein